MDDSEKLLQTLKQWIERQGPTQALSKLTGQGISARTADSLVRGTYKARPSALLRQALRDVLMDELKAS